MIIERVGTDGRTKLLLALNKLTSSFTKRGVSFIITAHSEFVANINLTVSGKLGSTSKTIIVVYNQASLEWEGYCDGYIFKMSSLNEISTVIKSKINRLSALLLKV